MILKIRLPFIGAQLTAQPSDEEYFQHKIATIIDNHARYHRYNSQSEILNRLTSSKVLRFVEIILESKNKNLHSVSGTQLIFRYD